MADISPAPWAVAPGWDSVVVDARQNPVAVVLRGPNTEQFAVNRALVTSAPDLLDACELALSIIRFPTHLEAREQIRMAVALARGEAVRCGDHGETEYCYVQPDGSHVPSEECACYCQTEIHCPVLEHAAIARERDRRMGVYS